MSSAPDNVIRLPTGTAFAAGTSAADDIFNGAFSPAEALSRLRARLLDLTRQNRLLHFRHPKGRSLQFVNVDIEAAFRRLANGDGCGLLWVPEPPKTDYAPGPRPEAREWAKDHHKWDISIDLAPPRGDLPSTQQSGRRLHTLFYPPDFDRVARAIARDANAAIEETGVNVLHLIFGFLEFVESEDSEKPLLAPLVTLPVTLNRQSVDSQSGFYRYDLAHNGDDYSENLTLREKLWQDFHIKLPTFDEDAGVEAYLDDVRELARTRPGWRVRRQMSLGLLSFAKLALWHDLNIEQWPAFGEHAVIKALFQGNTSELGESLEEHDPQAHPSYAELIFDADVSQNRAVIDVLAGRNLVIDGPPGTGKSQTITNIIASAMAAGKSVLFVSEKLAALQVVHRRLAQAKLAPFLLELHSNKAQKKQLLEELAVRMQATFDSPPDHPSKLATFKRRHEQLERYVKLVNSVTGNQLNKTVFDIFWAADRRRGSLGVLAQVVESLELPDAPQMPPEALTDGGSAVQSLATHFDAVGDPGPSHPWFGFDSDRLADGDQLRIAEKLRDHLQLANAVRSATAEIATTVGIAEAALARPAITSSTLAMQRIPEPSAAVDGELVARLYPSEDSKGHGTAATATRFIASLANLKQLQEIASRCQIPPAEATPDRLTDAQQAAALLRKTLGPGRPLSYAREAGRSLIALHKRIESSLAALAESARLAGIPFDGTRASVTAVCAVSQVAKAAPTDLLSWRHHGMAAAGAKAQLDELRAKHGRLLKEREQIEALFYLDPEPPADSLPSAISALRSADGLFAILRSEVRAARRLYRQLARKRRKAPRRECADQLATLSNFLSAHRRFESNDGHQALLGRMFAGIATDLDKAQRLIEWCAESQRHLVQAGNPSFDFIGAPERALVVLAETSEQAVQFARELDASKNEARSYIGTTSVTAVSGPLGEWRKLAEEALQAGRACTAAHVVLARVGSDTATPEALVAALEAQVNLPTARTQLDQDAVASQLLGKFFAGSGTNLATVTATWEWGQALANSGLTDALRGHIIGPQMRERSADVRGRLERLAADWNRLASLPAALKAYGQLAAGEWLGVSDAGEESADRHAAAAKRSLDHLQDLLPWVQYRASRKSAKAARLDDFVTILEQRSIPSTRLTEAFECVFYSTIARSISRTHSELATFSSASHDQVRAEFCALDANLKQLNGARLAHLLSKREVPQGTAGPSPKDYSERQLLVHEISKRKRHIAIRQLLARGGNAVKALKPCWMMSPLSVAHYLKPESVRFDMVVMDEASQIRPEEALGAIARAAQVVVVGDPNQLPPTSFFERSFEGADDDESEEEVGAAFSGTQSILEVANQFYPTRYLKWHYRSHHQSLIDFSNVRFYQGRLIVFPSPNERNPQLGVTYHYVDGATYASRQNLTEAQRVIDAILEHVAAHAELSLGVATLNLTQRNLIEELLEQRVRGDGVWNTYVARWQKQGLPFFVKNLENVQGDERDVIFVSTTFGPPPGGTKPFQRFGPIGTPTGWRRLNVLFTRARLALHIYTSLRPEDIVVDETTRRGTGEFRNYLEYARDGKIGAATPTGREPDSDFEVAVADLLRARDYDVVPQLGVAGFFIDLAVRNPHRPGEFLAAIECDGATYHSGVTVRDRDRIREQILEDLGWRGRIYRIWSTDWFRNRAHEAQKLLQFLDSRAAQSEAAMAAQPLITRTPKPPPASAPPKRVEEPVQQPLLVEEATDEERYVEVGDIVTYEDSAARGKTLSVRIVDREPDKLAGEVNENAPLARALLDMAVGEENELQIPGQPARRVRVVRIEAPKHA